MGNILVAPIRTKFSLRLTYAPIGSPVFLKIIMPHSDHDPKPAGWWWAEFIKKAA